MKTYIFWIIGFTIALAGFASASQAHAMTVISNDVIGTQNAVTLASALNTLQTTLNDLRVDLVRGNIIEPQKISATLSAIRSNLLDVSGTIAALDARTTHLASNPAPAIVAQPAPKLVVSEGLSYDNISAARDNDTSYANLKIASAMNIGKRVWPIALIILALTIPFLFRKRGGEPSVVVKTVAAPVAPATVRNV